MSVMSDLDLMVREGARTVEDFEARGIERDKALAMAEVVARTEPVQAMLGESRLAREIEEQRAYEVLKKFGLIDGEGFYTVYETKR